MKYRNAMLCALMSLFYGCGGSHSGQMIDTPGVYELGGLQPLTVKVEPNTDGKLRVTFIEKKSDGGFDAVSPVVDLADNWFVFSDKSGRVWYFNGIDNLSVITREEKNWTIVPGLSLIPEIPPAVLTALPEALKKRISAEQGGEGNG